MRTLNAIVHEQRLNLDNTQKAIIASIAIAPTPEMAYGVLIGARNSVTATDELVRAGYVSINNTRKQAELTDLGQEVLVHDNLTDETGELTDRGEDLVARYRLDKKDWKRFESFKYINSV